MLRPNPTCGISSQESSLKDIDILVIGSGIGGLVAGALLAYYGKRVVICESHRIPGGAAHHFHRDGFQFDSGPSFYCGLADPNSLNPLQQVLTLLGETLPIASYDPLGIYHFPDRSLPIYADLDRYQTELAHHTPQGAIEFAQLKTELLNSTPPSRAFPPSPSAPTGGSSPSC